MTKMEKFMSELEKLKTPDNEKVVGKLMEGVNLIADEYRRRKASEKAAKLEAEGFASLDAHRKASGLSTKAFVEGVGKTIMESAQPEEIKSKMMNSLSRYARHLTESAGVCGCIYSMEPVDEQCANYIISNNINGLLQNCVLPNSEHKYGDAATAKKSGIDQVISDNGTDINGYKYKLARKLIDSDHEKLFVLTPEDDSMKMPYVLHYADTPKAAMDSAGMDAKEFTECIGNAIINSDFTEKTKSAMLEGFGQWIKDKTKTVGRKIGSTYGGKTYYDEPEAQARLIDNIVKAIKGISYNKFSKKNDFEIETTGPTNIKGNIICTDDTKAPFTVVISQADDGTKLTFSYQLPGQQETSKVYTLTPEVKPYLAAAQIRHKLNSIHNQLCQSV